MPDLIEKRLSVPELRRARRMAYLNAMLWSFGNGLVSTMLVIYLAMDLGLEVVGLGVSLVVAAPQIVGLLRMAAPSLISRLGDRKAFCLASFTLSALVLMALPLAVAGRWLPSAGASLYVLVAVWCMFHLLQYLATVALWSWYVDLVPLRIRGRFIGRRERWMVAAQAVAMLLTGLFSHLAGEQHLDLPDALRYGLPTIFGATFMLAAIVPLARMPRVGPRRAGPPPACLASPQADARLPWMQKLATLAAPFFDRRFAGLMLFGCWFSFFNGITQSAQFVYGDKVLSVSLAVMLSLRTVTRLGQFTLSPSCGRLADRLGDLRVLVPCLLLVAQGPLFYLLATPAHAWLIGCAWIIWIAWAGVNVALPNLMLRLAPQRENASYIAAYYALTGVCYAGSTIAGGWLVDAPHCAVFKYWQAATGMDRFRAIFLVGWIARMAAVPLLLLLVSVQPRGRAKKHGSRQ